MLLSIKKIKTSKSSKFLIKLLSFILILFLLFNLTFFIVKTAPRDIQKPFFITYGLFRIIITDETLVELLNNPPYCIINSKYQNFFIESMEKLGYTYLPDESSGTLYVFTKNNKKYTGNYSYGPLFSSFICDK